MGSHLFFWGLVVLCLILTLAVFLLDRFVRKGGVKYIPAAVMFVVGALSLLKAVWFSQSFEDIAYLLVGIVAVCAFLVTLSAALLLDLWRKLQSGSKK